MFAESSGNRLYTKISKIKSMLEQLLRVVEETPDVRVSFSVFEGIKILAQSQVSNYRGLRVLQEIKSSFVATFIDGSEERKIAAMTV